MRRSPAVVDRKAIAEHAWADETDPLGSNAIDVQLSRLRAQAARRRGPHRHRARRRLPPGGSGRATRAARARASAARRSASRSLATGGRRRGRTSSIARGASCCSSTQDLTQQIDDRLVALRASHIGDEPGGPPDSGRTAPAAIRARSAPPYLVWTIHARRHGPGTQRRTAVLPDRVPRHDAPTTVIGRRRRHARRRRRRRATTTSWSARRSTRSAQAQSTILLAELLIAPVLLVVVFLGAVAIGRRVAAPIERARQRQLEFTADASHELRTPLSVIEAHTSLALTQPRDADWYRHGLRARRPGEPAGCAAWSTTCCGSPGSTPSRVDARLPSPSTSGSSRPRRWTGSRPWPSTGTCRWRVAVPAEPAVVMAPPDWLDRLLGVLLDNACKYAPDGGSVIVTVTPGGRPRAA